MPAVAESLSLFIGGEWVSAAHRTTEPVVNPATGDIVRLLPHASLQDLDRALAAAADGFNVWRRVSPNQRSAVLRRAAEFLRERAQEIAIRVTLEQGKPLSEAAVEVASAAEIFEWNAEEGCRAYGRIIPARGSHQRQMVLKEPVGPAALFTPWNFPVNLPARKISSALAAGCSCIIKPAEETPSASLMIAQALEDAGLPAGVTNPPLPLDGVDRNLLPSCRAVDPRRWCRRHPLAIPNRANR
jgi:succinate-semialdehyde dehydrogenase / glutarate-semialdehyde dehydrogenase